MHKKGADSGVQSTSYRAFSQASIALSSACWRSFGLLARMAAVRCSMNVPSSSISWLGSSFAKSRFLRSILSLANVIALCLLYRGWFSSALPRLFNGRILPLSEEGFCAIEQYVLHSTKRG